MRDQTCPAVWSAGRELDGACRAMVKHPLFLRHVLIGGILVSLSVMGISKWVSHDSTTDSDAPELSAVLVVDHYVPAFEPVTARAARVKNVAREFVPPGALHSLPELNDAGGHPLYVSLVALPEGQPITRSLLSEIGKNRGLSSLIPSGHVAVSFSADAVKGVGGWVQPGDAISIFQTPLLNGSNLRNSATSLLLPRVKVLAVGRNKLGDHWDSSKDAPRALTEDPGILNQPGDVITVSVNPLQASALVDARERGGLSIVLRPMGEELPWDSNGK